MVFFLDKSYGTRTRPARRWPRELRTRRRGARVITRESLNCYLFSSLYRLSLIVFLIFLYF